MQKNVGTVDRWIRGILGIALLWLAFTSRVPWPWLVGIVGAVVLATGVVGYCTLYKLFGISTCPQRPADLKK